MFRLNTFRSVARQSQLIAKRTYAEAASTEALRLSFSLPHDTLYNLKEVTQVNVPGVNGDFGVLANHVPTIEQLRPGIVEIIESAGTTKQFFVSGGFVAVQPNSVLSITAIEAFEPSSFSADAIKTQLSEAQKNVTSTDEAVAAEAGIQIEILEALQQAISK